MIIKYVQAMSILYYFNKNTVFFNFQKQPSSKAPPDPVVEKELVVDKSKKMLCVKAHQHCIVKQEYANIKLII
jgi:hypothetical protein